MPTQAPPPPPPRSSLGSIAPASRRDTAIACNRCHKPLVTTLFVCACDCVFCDNCAYEHFSNSSDCPLCHKRLGRNDFVELTISDPSTASKETLKTNLQTMFTKYSPQASYISHTDLCGRVLKSMDDSRRVTRLLLRQFIKESADSGRRSGTLGQENEQLRAENARLQQAASGERATYEQTVAELRTRLQSMSGTLQEAQDKIAQQQVALQERDTQVAQYRDMMSSSSRPSSGHSGHSGGGGGRGRTPPAFRHHHHQGVDGFSGRSPLDAFRGSPRMVNTTPMQSMPHSANSSVLGHPTGPLGSHGRNNGFHASSTAQVPPPTPPIRDFTTSSGYQFHSKRRGVSRFARR